MIKKYKQFAKDNWYEESGWEQWEEGYIMSKPFIEAVARGINKEWIKIDCDFIYWGWSMEASCELHTDDKIAFEQAIAIRDNKLEEFITNILPSE